MSLLPKPSVMDSGALAGAELADACGVSRRTVEGWETGRMPTAAALNVMSTLV